MLTDHRKVVAWLAWVLCLLCVALASGNVLLWILNGRAPIVFMREGDAAVMVLWISFSVIWALIVCAAALCQALSEFGPEYTTYALVTRSTCRSGCARRVGWRGGKVRTEQENSTGMIFVTLFVTIGRRLAPRMAVKEVR